MFIRIVVIILSLVCLVMGVHYFHYRFGIGPGLPDLTASFEFLSPSATPVPLTDLSAVPATDSATAQAGSLPQQLGTVLAVPLILDSAGVASASLTLDTIKNVQPTMVVLFGADVPATAAAAVTAQLRALPQPPLVAVDHEGGSVQRLAGEGFTVLPSWQKLCTMPAQQRTNLIASSAAELRAVGVDVLLGPVIDLTASGSALRARSCASDPDIVAALAQELVTIYQRAGVTPVLKHYPGIGSARADLHSQSALIELTPEDTRPFESLLLTNPTLPVMISHVRISPADPKVPCSMSTFCVGELHRVFPEALLVSDALEMKSAGYLASSSAVLRPLAERASAAHKVGVELLLFGPSVTELDLQQVVAQLIADFSSTDQLDQATLNRIVRVKQWREAVLRRGQE